MSLCTARVAPEKAVFRPALPLHPQPEFTGEQMPTKKSYSDQLKHPNWQRKRLEVLQAAGFECEVCGDKESTLHVHHKRYVKGREVWEYTRQELACLCEQCHADQHEVHGLLEEVLARADYFDPYRTALALVSGYMLAVYALDEDLEARVRAKVGYRIDMGVVALNVATMPLKDAYEALTRLNDGLQGDPVLNNMLSDWKRRIESSVGLEGLLE